MPSLLSPVFSSRTVAIRAIVRTVAGVAQIVAAGLFAVVLDVLPFGPASAGSWYDLSDHIWSGVLEAGPQFTPSLDVSGPNQSSFTTGWGGTGADLRAELWLRKPGALNVGITLQPIFLNYSGTLSSSLTVKGQTFAQGESGKFTFQFPFALVTGNYPVWSNGANEVRLGASIITRYAFERLSAGVGRVGFANTIALPLLNGEAHFNLGGPWAIVAQANVLPAENGTGIYDAFLGVHYDLGAAGRAVEVGSRTFYGGFVPNAWNQLNSRVLLQSVAVRFLF